MMGDLFDYGTEPWKLARTDGPQTSKDAADAVDSSRLEKLVHKTIAHYPGGCIAAEVLSDLAGLPYSSVTARFKALTDKGFISCGPDTRPGPSGRQQRVMRSVREP